MDTATEILQKRIAEAPKEIRDFLASGKWSSVTSDLAIRKGLAEEQKTSLENEVLFVLVGLDTKDNFRTNLSAAGLEQNQVNDIYSEVNSRIFKEIETFLPREQAEETLKSIPENKPETQEIAPRVVVEAQKKPINLIPPPTEKKPLDLLPPNLPTGEPIDSAQGKPANMIENKLSQVVSAAPRVERYEGGKDPYREPTN